MARLIEPAEFGLFAMVTVAVGFLSVFKDFGLGAALIQKKEPSDVEISSVFWLNVLMGFLIGILIYFSAPLLARFYSEPALVPITEVMGLTFFLGSFGLVPDALIRKGIDFKSLFLRNISNIVISGILGIILALYGFGVWALVFNNLFTTIFGVIISFRMIKWRPSFHFSLEALKPIMRFSFPLLGENSINYWVRNVDNLLVGKILGEQTLGYYSKAYNLMLLPVKQVSGSIIRVMFPSLSIIKDDKGKVWQNYSKLLSVTAFFTFPLMGFLYIVSKEFIILLYGTNWLESVPIFQGLCFLGAIQSIGVYSGIVFSSQGKTYLQFKVGLFLKPLMILGIAGGLYWQGIHGMIIGYTLMSTLGFFIESYFVTNVLNQKLYKVLQSFYKEAIISIIVILILIFINKIYPLKYDMIKIIFNLGIGAVLYFALASYFNLEGMLLLKEKIKAIKKR